LAALHGCPVQQLGDFACQLRLGPQFGHRTQIRLLEFCGSIEAHPEEAAV
jgi:hypothetical protein